MARCNKNCAHAYLFLGIIDDDTDDEEVAIACHADSGLQLGILRVL